jgi:hypothetical protein
MSPAERYIFQLPGTQATPMVRTSGDPLYSDRTGPNVYITTLVLKFSVSYTVPIRVRVFAFRRNNEGPSSEFVFRHPGHDVHLFHLNRGDLSSATGVMSGVLTDDGYSPLQTITASDSSLGFLCPSGDPIEALSSGQGLVEYNWTDNNVAPAQFINTGHGRHFVHTVECPRG